MPVISNIGRRSWRVRAFFVFMYAILLLGATTMVYPLLLMLSGSVKSETDIMTLTPVPAYLRSDEVLFRKYAESKYQVELAHIRQAWGRPDIRGLETLPVPAPEALEEQVVPWFLEWRASHDWPLPWTYLGHATGMDMLPANARGFRAAMRVEFNGDIGAFEQGTGVPVPAWHGVFPPTDYLGWSRLYNDIPSGLIGYYQEYAHTRPAHERVLFNLDVIYGIEFLGPHYERDIARFNTLNETEHLTFLEMQLPRMPPDTPRGRDDWEAFVREVLNVHFIRLAPQAAEGYRAFLRRRYRDIDALNAAHQRAYTGFDEVQLPDQTPNLALARIDLTEFIEDRELCPLEAISVYSPRHAFEDYVSARQGVPVAALEPLRLPLHEVDWLDMTAQRSVLRREFLTRNYIHVWQYLAQHGRGIINTIIYCALAIAVALFINPVAAYGLSRYKPPSTYKIILFMMATMAFPPAVTMIPNFMLLRRFPLWPLASGLAGFLAAVWIIARFLPRVRESRRLLAGIGIGTLIGWWLTPNVLGLYNISLLNTFAALVLPSMANGYFVFLLKGFFDSLPRELYEAADIDGASEWTKFWTLTMNLSKPILAVIALQAFVGAYSNFMMALIIIPDQRMWTLMVWIYQLQTQAHLSVVYASLVIAAVPTFVIFSLCQRVIIRGIVVPSDK